MESCVRELEESRGVGVENLGPPRGRSDAGKLVRMGDRRLPRRLMLSILKSGEG